MATAYPVMQPQPATHHWVRIEDATLDLILTFDPEDPGTTGSLLDRYRRWRETVLAAVEDGLES